MSGRANHRDTEALRLAKEQYPKRVPKWGNPILASAAIFASNSPLTSPCPLRLSHGPNSVVCFLFWR